MNFGYETNAERSDNYFNNKAALENEYNQLKGNPSEEIDNEGYVERIIN
jgi:hypothetical protein